MENLQELLEEIRDLHVAFMEELKRPSLSAFRRMRKVSSHLTHLYKEFRKISPKSKEELEAFKETWKGGEK